MNESILLEALKGIVGTETEIGSEWRNVVLDIKKLATEAIKKWEDSSGKETGKLVVIEEDSQPSVFKPEENFSQSHNEG